MQLSEIRCEHTKSNGTAATPDHARNLAMGCVGRYGSAVDANQTVTWLDTLGGRHTYSPVKRGSSEGQARVEREERGSSTQSERVMDVPVTLTTTQYGSPSLRNTRPISGVVNPVSYLWRCCKGGVGDGVDVTQVCTVKLTNILSCN